MISKIKEELIMINVPVQSLIKIERLLKSNPLKNETPKVPEVPKTNKGNPTPKV